VARELQADQHGSVATAVTCLAEDGLSSTSQCAGEGSQAIGLQLPAPRRAGAGGGSTVDFFFYFDIFKYILRNKSD
jgi:hypothetical protein